MKLQATKDCTEKCPRARRDAMSWTNRWRISRKIVLPGLLRIRTSGYDSSSIEKGQEKVCHERCWGIWGPSQILSAYDFLLPYRFRRWTLSKQQMAASCQTWRGIGLSMMSTMSSCTCSVRVGSVGSFQLEGYKWLVPIQPSTQAYPFMTRSKRFWQSWEVEQNLVFVTTEPSSLKGHNLLVSRSSNWCMTLWYHGKGGWSSITEWKKRLSSSYRGIMSFTVPGKVLSHILLMGIRNRLLKL